MIDLKFSIPINFLYKLAVKFIIWVRKTKTIDNGEVGISKVIHQGKIFSCLNNYTKGSLTIQEIPGFLRVLAEKNIDKRYRKDGSDKNNDKLPNEEKIKVLVNNTRISTFFLFTDGKRVLLHNREKSDSYVKTHENDKYDCFGSVSFENSSIKLKIETNDFFDSKILEIDCIPGFAFEDTIEPYDNLLGRQTVIMVGFVFYLSLDNLKKAKSTKTSVIELFDLSSLPSQVLLTSKARLGLEFLQIKNDKALTKPCS